MKVKIKVLFAAFEAEPFLKTGGLGDVAGSLPKALNKRGADVRLIMPKFSSIPEEYRNKMTHVADFYIDMAWRHLFCGVEMLKQGGVTCYFIDNEYYFKRQNPYGYFDDGERIAFFSKAILESIKYLPDFTPDILHCNDWHTGLCPVFMRCLYSGQEPYNHIKTVFTVHNLRYQGMYSRFIAGDVLGLREEEAGLNGLYLGNAVNYMRGGLCCSDRITTVSPTYANEICTDYYGENLQSVFNLRRNVLTGILNGIDNSKYDPMKDKSIYVNYNLETIDKKRENKERFQQEMGLKVDSEIPLAVLISRLTEQKGLDLLVHIAEDYLREDVQLAVLGVGDYKYEEAFRYFAGKYPDKMAAKIMFDEKLSRKFYAAADIVLVPSNFEPCGLTQMIAMRYGALPLVRETGGLRDSVVPYNRFTGEGNGFSFANYNAHEFLFTMQYAVSVFRNDKKAWAGLVSNAMQTDFSWSASAGKYMELYKDLLK